MVLRNVSLFAAAVLLAGASCQTMAKGPQLKSGMNRSAVSFGYWSTTADAPTGPDVDTDSVMLGVTHGYFVTNAVEVGGQIAYNSSDTGATETTSWVLAALGRWYFSNGSSLYPFLQGEIGLGNVDNGTSDDDLIRYGIGIGVMQFITASTALDAILKYQADSYDKSDVDVTGFHVELTYSVFW